MCLPCATLICIVRDGSCLMAEGCLRSREFSDINYVDLYPHTELESNEKLLATSGTGSREFSGGSGTATPTISSLDVRGLWHGQVVTRGRREASTRLSEREKCGLWQRELEIVLVNRRKQDKLWQQELHKYQVVVLEAEARQAELLKAQQELSRLAGGGENDTYTTPRCRLTFQHLHGLMEEQVRGGLRQASRVWVQVALLRGQLAKLRRRLEQGRDAPDADPGTQPTSQVNFLKKQLEHEDAKTRVARNNLVLSQLLRQLEAERRRATRLQEDNQAATTRLEELKSRSTMLQEELERLSHNSCRINAHLRKLDSRTEKKLKAVRVTQEPVMTVEEYLRLNLHVDELQKKVAAWRIKAEALN
ncbi:centriole and centriolar satellite protein ofd1-like [Procambarus clarkii]|uniref:centriole and centriolar satellite protein ofd1-like n=1 Tax=Procambarus clarkii TaxID=6728 RepID=UPI003742B9FD